ncbi:type II toxin-antitoxin system RelB/DinJ family antitoxin [Bifidobacterium pseudocatenulatum]|uniref:type II toxin-antitoxin system RelB/DinJ family antitoxin n=1 Tax=Bifidobacterium pseudocatenulatum TaxID=28026 RepID=UPI00216B05F8|nr:type II toxin-antitoxin system RelB/DinJ family antitoxin [Bifidobacterium pseudocatenulatum]
MALIQINVPDDVKVRADAAFARNGITTPGAMKMMVTQVASENRTPFDGLFFCGNQPRTCARCPSRYASRGAREYGLLSDDATDARIVPDSVLNELGLTAEEVGR